MTQLNLYTGSFIGKEEDIFKSLRQLKNGDILQEDGLFSFFYEQVNYPCSTLFLKTKKRVKFFYVDHDDFLNSIIGEEPHWILDIDKNLLKLNLIFAEGQNQALIVFNFDLSKKEFQDAIKLLAKGEIFDLYFISILYGGLVMENRIKYKIPKSILKTFKSLK